jgi:hypothetical protein
VRFTDRTEIDVRPHPSDEERRAVELALSAEEASAGEDVTPWRRSGLEAEEDSYATARPRPRSRLGATRA